VENFCVAKPQKSDLQPVERTKCAMLQRLVEQSRYAANKDIIANTYLCAANR
jgi:hypothetical protein